MTHDDIRRQIPDYVLGILSPGQLGTVERHVAHCTVCQNAMIRERNVGQLVRSTVNLATRPNNARIRSLMPAVPQKRRLVLRLDGWQKQLAPALIILLLILGGFTLNWMLPAGSVPSLVATAHAAPATSTYTPTATITQSQRENDGMNHLSNIQHSSVFNAAVSFPSPGSDRPLQTPDPVPTPVAAIQLVTAQ